MITAKLTLVLPAMPLAHVAEAPRGWDELATAWSLDPLLLFTLVVSAWAYRRGTQRLRRQVREGRGIRRWERLCFWLGWGTLVFALVSPLHRWGQVLFAAHMTQHELLMLVAAPLLVLGRPLVAFLFAIPRADARQLSRYVRRPGWRRSWRVVAHPLAAWLIHAAALWVWHAPALYEATLTNDVLHHVQHVCFFGSALLFWWAVLQASPGAAGVGAGALYLFTTMMHSGLLGALITFSDGLVYPSYQYTAPAWNLTPLEDQQLGGLIMWVPAGFVYIVSALALIGSWLLRAERTQAVRALQVASRAAPGSLLVLLLLTSGGCSRERDEMAGAMTGGDTLRGREVIREVGCGSCHTIPGVSGANALVGPPLTGIASRSYIGGVLSNSPENMVKWLLDPPAHAPGTVMPNLKLTEDQARDVAAYLYTLRE